LEKKLIFRKIEEKAKKNQQRGEKVKVLTNKDLLYLAIGVTLSVKKVELKSWFVGLKIRKMNRNRRNWIGW